jgi:hypothetical protein
MRKRGCNYRRGQLSGKSRATVKPTQERHWHNGGLIAETVVSGNSGIITRYRAVWECPLDVYRDRRILSPTQYRAGLRLRRAFRDVVARHRAMCSRMMQSLSLSETSSMSDKIIKDASAIVAAGDMPTVIDVCGYDQLIWNPNALDKLRRGLGHLAVAWHSAAMELCDRPRGKTE